MKPITKLQAAETQAVEAIKLIFENRDPISIHTLVGASNTILNDLGKLSGAISVGKNSPAIKEQYRKEWREALARHQNFFKHADYDPEASIEFIPELSHYQLLDSIIIHQQIVQTYILTEFHIFFTWFSLKYPNSMNEPYKSQIANQANLNKAKPDRLDLWKKALDSASFLSLSSPHKPFKSIEELYK